MPRLPAAPPLGLGLRQGRLGVRVGGRRRQRGVGRVLVEPGLQLRDFALELGDLPGLPLDQGQDVRWQCGQNVRRNRRGCIHAAGNSSRNRAPMLPRPVNGYQLFRGSKAHDYEWLRDLYYLRGGARFPPEVVEAFSTVAVWGTELRYQPGTVPDDDAEVRQSTISAWKSCRRSGRKESQQA